MNTEALLVVDVQEEYIERYDDGLLKHILRLVMFLVKRKPAPFQILNL